MSQKTKSYMHLIRGEDAEDAMADAEDAMADAVFAGRPLDLYVVDTAAAILDRQVDEKFTNDIQEQTKYNAWVDVEKDSCPEKTTVIDYIKFLERHGNSEMSFCLRCGACTRPGCMRGYSHICDE